MVDLRDDLSVLPGRFQYSLCRVVLMVTLHASQPALAGVFQYSLCRVVLMVPIRCRPRASTCAFQYSLCRVVLMVMCRLIEDWNFPTVSVLALSSRFDGHPVAIFYRHREKVSVLALSSRFDGPGGRGTSVYGGNGFSTRSVESF